MSSRILRAALVILAIGLGPSLADEVLYRYEGDVLPHEESAGWIIDDPCLPPCSESLEDGHFVLRWPELSARVVYVLWIAPGPLEPPPTLWVEWQFRSNHPLGPNFFTCDGQATLFYKHTHEVVFMYGDAAISISGGDAVTGLDIDAFHTYRFESPDGASYRVSVDGVVFIQDTDSKAGANLIGISGNAGCVSDWIPDMVNEWDFVRFGSIGSGEQIIAADPPAGYLDPAVHAGLDRFTVTFDSANYVYIDDITVQVSGGELPVVAQTGRRDNGEPETVEIVLDRPIPNGETTTFTLNDGQSTHEVVYTFIEPPPPPPIPTVSTWGLVVLTLLVLTIAKTTLFPRRSMRRQRS